MARACSICSHSSSAVIDQRLTLKTASVVELAEEFKISTQAIYRHQREHLSQTVLRELRLNRDTSTTDLLEALGEALADVQAVRSAALVHGQSSLLLRAAASTQSIATTLLDRLAPDNNLQTVRLLKEGERLARAVGAAAREEPLVAQHVAFQLRAQGEHDTADALIRLSEISNPQKGITHE